MQEASVQGFIRTLLIIILVYYGLKIIGKIVFPMVFKRYVGKFEEKFKNQQQQQQTPKQDQKIGETVIDKKPSNTKTSNNDVGEYVDFEEVD
ncbi:DUF4834 family protein [Urechidicola croceus]|uniref:DUF4834 domain-containing protein n=1 Tax=Urechidicola croceus TaxID=1850246 RepID=A0A1D8PBH6_9FLAO|nr:DUF4834 family protein [Urechidicola croceus]AOW21929.1 DUF4834 domain-containing protein [Urechidicola croceus]